MAGEYRKRGIGLDGIVLDWFSWEDGLWGQKSFDTSRFPEPSEMLRKLHEMDVHFMISVWPTMDEKSENYKEFKEQKLLLPGSNAYNVFSEKGRALFWKQVKEGLFCHGIEFLRHGIAVLDDGYRCVFCEAGRSMVLARRLFRRNRGFGLSGAVCALVSVGMLFTGVPGSRNGLPQGTLDLRRAGRTVLRGAFGGEPLALPVIAVYLFSGRRGMAGGQYCADVPGRLHSEEHR